MKRRKRQRSRLRRRSTRTPSRTRNRRPLAGSGPHPARGGSRPPPVPGSLAELRAEVERRGGLLGGPGPGVERVDPAMEEAFLRSVLAYDDALENPPQVTLAHRLIEGGLSLPAPDDLADDAAVKKKLWDVINGLAAHHHYLASTDHLSDRELYRLLWEVELNVPLAPSPADCPGADVTLIDLVSAAGPDEIAHWLAYYASPEERAQWASEFPERPLPPARPLPVDRDRHLPRFGPF